MSKASFQIQTSHLEALRAHIRLKFDTQSWWPAEGPLEAKTEFEKLGNDPVQLSEWCERWLNGGQWRELKKVALASPSVRQI